MVIHLFEADFLYIYLIFLRPFGFFLELAIDGYIDVLIKARIGLETFFGFSAAFIDREIVVEEPNPPFDTLRRVVFLQRVRTSLRLFDQLSIGYAGFRPVFREMEGI